MSENPLLAATFNTPLEALPFDRLRTEHFAPALEAGIQQAKANIEAIKADPREADFENTMVALETSDELLNLASETYFNLFSAEADEALRALAPQFSAKLAAYRSDLLLDDALFARIRRVHERRAGLNLSQEASELLEKTYRAFVRNGALLSADKKSKLRAIDQELATLSPQFSDNVLRASNAFELWVSDKTRLLGLPEGAMEAAAFAAEGKGRKGEWLFTLDYPSFGPFMKYCEDRALREQMYRAYAGRATQGDTDNSSNVKRTAQLRHERAQLLGYASHADFVLEERMAEKPQKVMAFLQKLLESARPAGEREVEEVKEFYKAQGGQGELAAWDLALYSEKLKKARFQFDDEELRPYFPLQRVIDGVFGVAAKLFSLRFEARSDIPVYHPDVKVFEVKDAASGKHIGLFYCDFHPRPTKRSGAWMTALREQGLWRGKVRRPHVSIVCNFTKPTPSKPALLSFDEVTTLFHEFGHALHGLLSECTYRSIAGTNVFWDFVELPSQIMENWAKEKEVLHNFARHFETGEAMPDALAEKIKKSAKFQAGLACLRQLSFAMLDMSWHQSDPSGVTSIENFEEACMAKARVLPRVPGTTVSCAFSHIFSGGYSAGYYSYKWAEVLDADAFELFLEKGLFDPESARRFRTAILSRGGTEHPMKLYREFRGREPDTEALLRRDGLL